MESGAIRSSKKFSGSLLAVSGRLSTYSKRGVPGGKVSKSCQPDIPAIVIGRYYDTGQPRIDASR
jgi:hypothetical protein